MDNLIASTKASFDETLRVLSEFTNHSSSLSQVAIMAASMAASLQRGCKIMACGNGGSAAQAMHFAEELSGRYRDDRKALAALALTDPTHMSCVGNDYGFDKVFSRAIEAYAKPGDGVLLLSTSGNSANLIEALQQAKRLNVVTYALLGKGGGKLKGLCDYEIVVAANTSDCVQNLHTMIIHCLIEGMERLIFPQNYPCQQDQLLA